MSSMRKSVFFLAGLFFLFIGCGDKESTSSMDKLCMQTITSFFDKIKLGEYVEALDKLLLSNPNIDIQDSATINLKAQFKDLNDQSGEYLGYQLLRKRVVENDLGAYSYLVKYEKKYYRFVFVFYNNSRSTRVYKFLFDNTLDIELEESLKFYTY